MPKTPTNQHVDLDNARQDDQRQVMRDIIAAGHCPFCPENLDSYHKLPILKEGTYWRLTENQWPYDHTQHHWLAIYRGHATTPQEMNPAAGAELIELLQWLEREYDLPGGGLAMRFGDTNYSAGTVAHLHVQILTPNLESPNYEPIRIKIGKSR